MLSAREVLTSDTLLLNNNNNMIIHSQTEQLQDHAKSYHIILIKTVHLPCPSWCQVTSTLCIPVY